MLTTEPDAALLRRLGMAGGLTARLATQGLAALMSPFFTRMFDLKVYGREQLGDRGYILCPNHASYLDGLLLAYAVPGPLRHRLFSLGYSGYFDVPVIRSLLKLIRVIPVDSGRNVVAALQMSAHILRQGQIMAIFRRFLPPLGRLANSRSGHPSEGAGSEAGPGLYSGLLCSLASRGQPAPSSSYPGILRPGAFLAGA
jgi:hypothetical protein